MAGSRVLGLQKAEAAAPGCSRWLSRGRPGQRGSHSPFCSQGDRGFDGQSGHKGDQGEKGERVS